MRTLLSIILLILITGNAWGGAITSAQSGNWSDTATWTGGSVPGDADTATIATGHTVTVASGDTRVIAGITISASAGTGGTLNVSGDLTSTGNITVTSSGATVDVKPGGILRLKGGAAGRPLLTEGAGTTYAYIKASGTGWGVGEFATIDGIATTADPNDNGAISVAERTQLIFSYVKLLNLGENASNLHGVNIVPKAAVTGQIVRMSNVLLDGCGTMKISTPLADTEINLSGVDIRNSIAYSASGPLWMDGSTAKDVGATRSLINVTYYGTVTARGVSTTMADLSVCNFYLYNAHIDAKANLSTPSLALNRQTYDKVALLRDIPVTGWTGIATKDRQSMTISNSLFLVDTVINPHYIAADRSAIIDGAGNGLVADGNIFTGINTPAGDYGEGVVNGYATIKNNIGLAGIGALVGGTQAADTDIDVINNTVVGAKSSLIQTGETSAPATMLKIVKNNFMGWDSGESPATAGIHRQANQAQTQLVLDYNASYLNTTAGNLDYPVGHTHAANQNSYMGAEGGGVAWISGQTFGADYATHDRYGDPLFANKNITVLSACGDAATTAVCAQRLVSINGWDHSSPAQRVTSSEYTLAAVLSNIRSALKPTASFMATGDPLLANTYIGAVQPVAAGGVTVGRPYRSFCPNLNLEL